MKKVIASCFLLSMAIFVLAQPKDKSSYLVLKYYDIPENKYEMIFLSTLLQKYNVTSDAEMEKLLNEGYQYYVEHQDEILTAIKTQELLIHRDNAKKTRSERRAEMWAPLIEALPNILSAATTAGIEAGKQQMLQNQQKINREREIQAFLAQHSSKAPKQYQQNFGNASVTKNVMNTPKVSTSNGYEIPIGSQNSGQYGNGVVQGMETVGMMVRNGSQQNVRIKVNGNSIVGIYVGGNVRSPLGDGWSQANIQGIPTNIQLDGEWAKMYKNRATSRDIDNAIIYF